LGRQKMKRTGKSDPFYKGTPTHPPTGITKRVIKKQKLQKEKLTL
jgi:hypothetical protein